MLSVFVFKEANLKRVSDLLVQDLRAGTGT